MTPRSQGGVCLFPLWLAALCWVATATVATGADQPRGLPFVRTYPLDEIGNVPRGLRLDFDAFGRIAVMYDSVYAVLNDLAWVERIDANSASKVKMTTIKVANGRYYYGGRGSWGTVEMAMDGRFRAAPLVPADAPAWTTVTPFNKLLATATAVYFYELNGVVCWDFARQTNIFFPMPRLAAAFPVGARVFVSCQDQTLRELLPASGTSPIATVSGLGGQVIEFAAPLDDKHTLVASRDGHLFLFDGETAVPWGSFPNQRINGRITAMERLVDGGVAIAVAGQGILLLSAEGTLEWSIVLPEFRRVGAMAAGEAGVLWVAGENAIHRIFYDSPLTSFGQPLGLTAIWPRVAAWGRQVVICSNGTLYRMEPAPHGAPPTFGILADPTTGPADNIATSGPLLLAGNSTGVFAMGPDGGITPVLRIAQVAGLEFIRPDTCVVIGSREIAAVQYVGGAWHECAPRIPGVGDSPIHIERHDGLWIEMGGDRVARLSLHDGQLVLQHIELPWHGAPWTNVGVVGDTIVLSGATGQRAYYNETRGALTVAPELDRLLNRSPYWILRVTRDAAGVLWATHAQGVVTFTPQDGGYAVDATTFELPNDSYPTVNILPGDDTWIAAGRSLYHVERNAAKSTARPHAELVSLFADQQHRELLDLTGRLAVAPRFSFDDNSLGFRFFSGTYAWCSPPRYEYRLGAAESWTTVDPSQILRFPKLRDGTYRLEVRHAGPDHAKTAPWAFDFVIKPPWYRTPASYGAAAVAVLLAIAGIARWINHHSLRRNAELERLVHERTRELEITMEKLGEETRNTATLAERSRLAGEMHDSLQQGLSGSILHLDTTMTHPSVTREVYAQLNVVRNMLSYSREEAQQAVWNLESPLLHNSTLGDALRKLAGYINTGTIKIQVDTPAEPLGQDQAVRHHLLRIAQEAITNAVKHAGANRIDVVLRSDASAVVLVVRDDGQGFAATAGLPADGHFGLRGLRARAKSIHARLEITSAPGAGTTVRVTVPLAQELSPHEYQPQGEST